MIKKLLDKYRGIILINASAYIVEQYLLDEGIVWWNESSEISLFDMENDILFIV